MTTEKYAYFSLIRLCCLVCTLIVWVDASAQQIEEYRVNLFTTENGLNTNYTKIVTKDQLGYTWVGSDKGVVRYDGHQVIDLTHYFENPYIKAVVTKGKDQVYVVGDMGIRVFKTSATGVSLVKFIPGFDQASKAHFFYPKDAFFDSKGRCWVSESSIVLMVEDSIIQKFPFEAPHNELSANHSFTLFEDQQHHVWAVSWAGGLFKFNETTHGFDPVTLPNEQRVPWVSEVVVAGKNNFFLVGQNLYELSLSQEGEVNSLQVIEDSEKQWSGGAIDMYGHLLLTSSNNGLYFYNTNKPAAQIEHIPTVKSKTFYNISCDQDNNFWAASSEGVCFLQRMLFAPMASEGYIVALKKENNTCWYADTKQLVSVDFASDGKSIINQKRLISEQELLSLGNADTYIQDFTVIDKAVYFCEKDNIWTKPSDQSAIELFTHLDWLTKIEAYDGALWAPRGWTNIVRRVDLQTKEVSNIDLGKEGREILKIADRLFITLKANAFPFVKEYNTTTKQWEDFPLTIDQLSGEALEIVDMDFDNDQGIWLVTNQGVLFFENEHSTGLLLYQDSKVLGVAALDNNKAWLSTEEGLVLYDRKTNTTYPFNKSSGITSQTPTENCLIQLYGRVIYGTVNGISYVKNEEILSTRTRPVMIHSLESNEGMMDLHTPLTIHRGDFLTVNLFSINYPSNNISYQYSIDGQPWKVTTAGSMATFMKLTEPHHQLAFRAKAPGGNQWSAPTYLEVRTVPYWYVSWWMWGIYLSHFILLMVLSAKWNTRRLKRNQIALEKIIAERTTELRQKNIEIEGQNEELHQQSEEILAQRDALANQHLELQESFETINGKNELITSSIKAANTIQKAILPKEKLLEEVFDEQFVIYHPKDIVSGDFYWFAQGQDFHTLAVIDCTGHGVPGAFMSMIANTILNAIVKESGISSPDIILDKLNQKVIKALDQQGRQNNNHGMDAAILTLQKVAAGMYQYAFAGAKNSLFYQYAAESVVNSIKGSRSSIGGVYNIEASFELHSGTLKSGDKVFLISDGIIDMQTVDRKKFGSINFRNFIEDHYNQSIPYLGNRFEQLIITSKATYPLRDDVTLVGGRLR